MELETIMQLVTVLVTLVLGVISKKNKYISNNLIPIQNIAIGLIIAIIQWIITKNFSVAVSLSGILAGGIYDIPTNLLKLIKPKETVGDGPEVYEEVEIEETIEEVDNGESND